MTAEGRVLHERADSAHSTTKEGVRIVRGLPLRNHRLGLVGRADVVEFHKTKPEPRVSRAEPESRPIPVEYKRGRPKFKDCDRVQLCAQALCLEEMFGVTIEHGALFYGKTRRRENVAFNRTLRELTEETAVRFHDLVREGQTPVVYRQAKCRNCSLLDVCLPPTRSQSVSDYFDSVLEGSATRPSEAR